MTAASSIEEAAHLLAYLDLRLEADLESGLAEWQQAFANAREAWQLGLAGRLLHLLKHYLLPSAHQAVVRTLEGQWLAQQAKWSDAVRAYERSLDLRPGQVAALSGLGNALRRIEGRASEAIARHQEALALADDETRADVLNNLGLANYEAGQLDDAQAVFAEARDLYRFRADQAREASALHNLGSIAWTRGRLAEAEECFLSALAIYQELGLRHELAETLNSLGLVQEAFGDWEEAAKAYYEALSVLQSDSDEYGQAQTLANLGNVLTLLEDYPNATACLENGLIIARALGLASLEGQLLTGLAEALQAQERTAEALVAFQQSLQRKVAGGDSRSLKHTWLSLGALHHRLRQLAEAESAYQKALVAARAQNDRRIETYALIDLAKLALVESKPDKAAHWIESAEPLAVAGPYAEALAEIAQLRGDLELLRPEPDYHSLLQHYTEALAHAGDFNPATLRRMVEYLVALIRALAADGQPETAVQMAIDLGQLVSQVGLPGAVFESFRLLAADIKQLKP